MMKKEVEEKIQVQPDKNTTLYGTGIGAASLIGEEIEEEILIEEQEPEEEIFIPTIKSSPSSLQEPSFAGDFSLPEEPFIMLPEIVVSGNDADHDTPPVFKRPMSPRTNRSLGSITKRFIAYLQEQQGKTMNIQKAVNALGVKQRRRLYDVTSVMEGIGLIEKVSRNAIQWKLPSSLGHLAGLGYQEKIDNLEAEIDALIYKELALDQQIKYIKENIRELCSEGDNLKYLYNDVTAPPVAFPGTKQIVVQSQQGMSVQTLPAEFIIENHSFNHKLLIKGCVGPLNGVVLRKKYIGDRHYSLDKERVKAVSSMKQREHYDPIDKHSSEMFQQLVSFRAVPIEQPPIPAKEYFDYTGYDDMKLQDLYVDDDLDSYGMP